MNQDVRNAMDVLRQNGYFVDAIWSIEDVQNSYICSDEQALNVLREVILGDDYCAFVNELISNEAQFQNLSRIEDDIDF